MYESELKAALDAAELARCIVLPLYSKFLQIPDAPADIHTEADRLSQEAILKHLRQCFPGDAFCAEEVSESGTAVAGMGARLWIIDPIDGTRGFARKNGEFSIMVAFADAGRSAVGVVLEPARERLTYAVRGGACWVRDGNATAATRAKVSATADLSMSALVQSRSRDPGVPSGQVEALKPARVVETYSAGIKLALVARGEVDLYVNRYLAFHDWDICAGQVLVEEAGGTVTGLAGEEIQYGTEGAWQRSGLLASNCILHATAIERLKAK
ncbi:MAG: inositol monophosphatase [Gemmataceae bacterium]|nr:inositol monophosphatase [Gemmataceae bacterium]